MLNKMILTLVSCMFLLGTTSLIASDFLLSPDSISSVTFNANMSVQLKEGNFKLSDELYLKGDLDGWGAGYKMTDSDGDSIYTVQVSGLATGKEYNHKFFYTPSGWEGDPNRKFVASNGLVVSRYFNDDSIYINRQDVTVNIEFTADLRTILGSGDSYFDPATDSLLVNGLDWDNMGRDVKGNRKLTEDPFNPGFFKTTLSVTGKSMDSTKWKFKAFPDNKFANGGWELGQDRWISYPTANSNLQLATIIPNIFPLASPLTADVTYEFYVYLPEKAQNSVDKSLIPRDEVTLIGIKGSPQKLGAWLGSWVPNDTATGTMVPMKKIVPNVWKASVVFPAGTPTGTFEYKFGAEYPGASTIPGVTGGFMDNEGGFGANHFANLRENNIYPLRLVWADFIGMQKFPDSLLSVERLAGDVPLEFTLEQNYPNPFNPSTKIQFSLPTEGFVNLTVYNALGEVVAKLIENELTAGTYNVDFDAAQHAGSIYFYSLQYNGTVSTKKMVLMK